MAPVTAIPLKPTGKTRTVHGVVRAFDGLELPFYLIEGKTKGPFCLVTAGVHGSEVNAIQTARQLLRMPAEQIKGTLLVIPILNMTGFTQHSIFVMPEDVKNLNRQFPGKADGTFSERVAHWLTTEIYAKIVEFCPDNCAYFDLHSGDLTEHLTPFTLFVEGDKKSQDLAMAYRLPFAVQSTATTLAVSGAASVGLPSLLVETGGNGVWSQKNVLGMSEGLARALQYLDMLVPPSNVKLETAEAARGWNQIGWLVAPMGRPPPLPTIVKTENILSPHTGFWIPNAKRPTDKVDAGECLGQIEGLTGTALGTVSPTKAGVVLYYSTALSVAEGDVLYCIGSPVEE